MLPSSVAAKVGTPSSNGHAVKPSLEASRNGHAKPATPAIRAYYDSSKKSFWIENTRREWIEVTESSLKRHIKAAGLSPLQFTDRNLTQVDDCVMRIQEEDDVHYAGPLAGYPPGLHDVCNSRILVTRGPKLIAPKGTACKLFRDFLDQLLGEQLPYFLGWIKSALESIQAGPPFRPGQLLAIAGPPGCGKSFLQNVLTELLGGRAARPYKFMKEKTEFNKDLLAAEHLHIEDELASTDIRTRRAVGASLKNLIVCEMQALHPKGKDAIPVTPFWRVTMTLNDEPESMLVLPPIDNDLAGKVILLKAAPATFPYGRDDLDGRAKFRKAITAELPGFVGFLRRWKIPPELLNQRFGVAAYQNAELLQGVHDLSPEARLLAIIDASTLFGPMNDWWEGTAADLERILRADSRGAEVDRVLTFPTACGVFLARLAQRMPGRIEKQRGADNVAQWRISKT